MRPRLVLGTVAATLALPLVGFVFANANAAESPTRGAEQSSQADARVETPTTPPAGDEGSSPEPNGTPDMAEVARPEPRESTRPTSGPTVQPIAPTRIQPSVKPTRSPSTRPSSPPSQVTRQADSPTGGWKVPGLDLGGNDITAPVMASGRTATVLVACAPSSACTVNGNTLTVGVTATSVTVTWSVPSNRTFRAWSTQASL